MNKENFDQWHLLEANEIIKTDKEFHSLRKKFEADVLELMNKQHPDSEIRGIMEDYINIVDDAFAETLEPATRKAEDIQDGAGQ